MFFIHTISQCRSRRLIDDSFYSQTSDLARFFSSLALRIVKVSRYRDYGFRHFLTQEVFSCFLHFLKNHSRDLLWSIHSAFDIYTRSVIISLYDLVCIVRHFTGYLVITYTHVTFDRHNGVGRVGDRLTFCRISYFTFSVFQKRRYRWRSATTFVVCNYNRLITFHYGNARVGCS
ncbi:NAD-specific glutamate dehydrogenase [compost metagenome]